MVEVYIFQMISSILDLYIMNRQDLFVTSEISSTTYTLTKLEWMNINSLCNGSYQVYVIAYSSAYYETGPFYSELFEFDLPSN